MSVVDWLVQIQHYLSLSDVTLHLAVANFDRVIDNIDFEQDEVQLLGLACLQLAAKVEEDCAPSQSLLLPLTGGVYSKEDLARMEVEVLRALDWRLRKTTSAVFLHYYSEISGKGWKVIFKLAKAVLDLCLTQVSYHIVIVILKIDYRPGTEQSNQVIWHQQRCSQRVFFLEKVGRMS